MSLTAKLTADLARPRPDVLKRYIDILTDDVDDAGQMEELKSIMAQLGKRLEDVQADRAILAQVKPLTARLRSGRDLRAAIRDAEHQLKTFNDQALQKQRGMDVERAQLAESLNELTRRQQNAFDASCEISNLKRCYPELLMEVAEPPRPDSI